MVRREKGDRSGFIRDPFSGKMQIIWRDRGCLQAVGPVVLDDQGATVFDVVEKGRHLGGEMSADVERADADDDRIQSLQGIRRELGVVQNFHHVAHLAHVFGQAVTGTRQITDRMPAGDEVEAYRFQAGEGLQQLRRDVRVIDFLAIIAVADTVNFRAGDDFGCVGLCRRGDRKCELGMLAHGVEVERLPGGRNGPTGRGFQAQSAGGIGA